MEVGDVVPIWKGNNFKVMAVDPNRSLVWASQSGHDSYVLALYPVDASHTRLVWRIHNAPYLWTSLWVIPQLFSDGVDLIAVRQDMLGIKERVAKRKPVETTRQGIASLLRSCRPRSLHHRGKHQTSKDERSNERDQRPVPSHPGGEFEEPIATIRDQTKDVEAHILGKIAYWRVERLKNPARRPPDAHHKAHETQREDKHSDCSIAWKCSIPGGGASPALKTIILDEFEAATGYARKYAIRFLSLAST